MEIEAVIFDLDGTLIHTKHNYIYGVVGSTLKRFDIEFDKELALELWFNYERNKIMSSLGIEPKKFWEIAHNYDTPQERKKYAEPYNDCHVLKKLSEKGIKLGVLTGTPQFIAEIELDKLGIEFDAVVFAHEEKAKPSPDGLDECLNLLETKKEAALFVGNGDEDIQAAKKIGMLDIHIDRGEHVIKTSPTKTIKTLEELLEMIK